MSVSRSLLACVGLLLAAAPAVAAPVTAEDLRWLDRVTWGVTAADVARLAETGRAGFLAEQLEVREPALPPAAAARVQALARLQRSPGDAWAARDAAANALKDDPVETAERQARHRALRDEDDAILREAGERLLLRAVYSRNQLHEQMSWFWFNHFNVFARKSHIGYLLADYEDGLRRHALGSFRDLLRASLQHPAMLRYLDNGRSRNGRINENYARELMELHTLGIDGGYTQKDVQELARVLTGLTAVPAGNKDRPVTRDPAYRRFGMVEFNPWLHDNGDKVLLGQEVHGSGWAEVEAVIDRLARHPSTARHVSRRLATYFVSDVPPPALVERMAVTFRDSDGDIRCLLEMLLASPEFAAAGGSKYKSSWQYLVSALRVAMLPPDEAAAMLVTARQLAQPPYERVTPDGYSLAGPAWRSAGQLETRLSIARDLSLKSRAAGTLDAAALTTLLPMLDEGQRQRVLAEADPQRRLMLFLGAPEFMYR